VWETEWRGSFESFQTIGEPEDRIEVNEESMDIRLVENMTAGGFIDTVIGCGCVKRGKREHNGRGRIVEVG